MNQFRVTWDRPIHLNQPGIQTDHGGQDLPEANSKEAALAIVERWKSWLTANKCFNIFLRQEGLGFCILTHISPE